jgi:very-short-patch-repair endonuclease
MTNKDNQNTPSPELSGKPKVASWKTKAGLWEKLKPFARQMRRKPTPAEDKLWQRIRNKQILNFKFRRQHTINKFIVDFYCGEAQLIIEVDGKIHEYTQEQDAIRQEFLESLGFKVIRFTNDEVLQEMPRVLSEIATTITTSLPSP